MQPVLSPATETQFVQSNGEVNADPRCAMAGWALVMCIALVSFLVHVNPGDGITAEQAAQGLLVMGAAVVLIHGSVLCSADHSALLAQHPSSTAIV